MPPKKSANIKSSAKSNKKLVSESSLKSADDDSIDRDDYELDTSSQEETTDEESEEESEELTESAELSASEEETESEEESDESVEPEEESAEEEEVDEEAEECLYKKAKVKNFDADEDDELELVYDDDNLNYNEIVKPEDRITKPFMTIFERVRLLGDRAKQLSLGAKPMIKNLESMMNPKEIAKLELEKGVIPLIIERVLPNGRKERWRANELKLIN